MRCELLPLRELKKHNLYQRELALFCYSRAMQLPVGRHYGTNQQGHEDASDIILYAGRGEYNFGRWRIDKRGRRFECQERAAYEERLTLSYMERGLDGAYPYGCWTYYCASGCEKINYLSGKKGTLGKGKASSAHTSAARMIRFALGVGVGSIGGQHGNNTRSLP